MNISPQTLDALVQVISGGSGMNNPRPSIGLYRSGQQLESFMRSCGVDLSITSGVGVSRLPALTQAIDAVRKRGDAATLKRIIERAADPLDFIQDLEKLGNVITYLNARLSFDGFELKQTGQHVRLIQARTETPVVLALADTLRAIDFDTVDRDLRRALESVDSDPESAVTSSCSIIESMCRSIIIELDPSLMPSKLDIQALFRVVSRLLEISPDRDGLTPNIASDVRTILGGLSTMVQGIGALRSHAGDAHGRERGFRRIEPRIAGLAVHSASAAALFVIETWRQRYPHRPLLVR